MIFQKEKMKQVRAVVIGAGARGHGYARYGTDFPERFKVSLGVDLGNQEKEVNTMGTAF